MQKRKPYKAKGAVLIMVLTIMFVLIFLLAGSVAVVYSSNRRVMIQYEESQAYYTARSVLDMYRGLILSDSSTTLPGSTYYLVKEDGTQEGKSGVVTPGRALELDLYKVPVAVGVDPLVPETYNPYFDKLMRDSGIITVNEATGGRDITTENQVKLKKWYYSRNLTNDQLNDSAFSSLNEQYTVASSFKTRVNNDIDPVKGVRAGIDDTLVYYVNYDGTKSNFKQYQSSPAGAANNPNKLADEGSDKIVKLYVQVLDRTIKLDSSVGDGDAKFDTQVDKINDASEPTITWQSAFNGRSRKDDLFTIKVTAEVWYDDEKVTTSVIYQNQPNIVQSTPPNKAVVSMNGASGSGETLLTIGGGSMLSLVNGIDVQNEPNLEGNYSIQSDFNVKDVNSYLFLDGTQSFFVRGNLNINNKDFLDSAGDFKDGASVYAGKGILLKDNGNCKLGDTVTQKKVLNIISPRMTLMKHSALFGRGIFEIVDVSNLMTDGVNTGEGVLSYKGSGLANSGGVYYCNYLVLRQKDKSGNDSITMAGKNITLSADTYKCVEKGAQIIVTKGIVIDTGSVPNSVYDPANPNVAPYTTYLVSDGYSVVSSGDDSTDIRVKTDGSIGEIKIDYDTDYKKNGLGEAALNSNYQRVFDLPVAILTAQKDGSSPQLTKTTIEVDTVRSLYNDYFLEQGHTETTTDTWTENGDLNFGAEANYAPFIKDHKKWTEDYYPDVDANTITGNYITFEGLYDNNNFTPRAGMKKVSEYAAADLPSNIKSEHNDWYVIPSNSTGVFPLVHSRTTQFNQGFVIDATKGPVTVQFGTTTTNVKPSESWHNGFIDICGRFAVYGDQPVTVIIPCGEEGTNLRLGSQGAPEFCFYRVETAEGAGAKRDYGYGVPGKVNLDGADKTPAPSNITWYISDKFAQLDVSQHAGMLMGDIKCPNALVNFDNNSPKDTGFDAIREVFTNSVYVHSPSFTCRVIGSLLCDGFKTGGNGKCGIIYIEPDPAAGEPDPGQPLFNWPPQYYTVD